MGYKSNRQNGTMGFPQIPGVPQGVPQQKMPQDMYRQSMQYGRPTTGNMPQMPQMPQGMGGMQQPKPRYEQITSDPNAGVVGDSQSPDMRYVNSPLPTASNYNIAQDPNFRTVQQPQQQQMPAGWQEMMQRFAVSQLRAPAAPAAPVRGSFLGSAYKNQFK